jgi:GT2 family glycosyltransferase
MIDVVVISSGPADRLEASLLSIAAAAAQVDGTRLIAVLDNSEPSLWAAARSCANLARVELVAGPMGGRAAARNTGAAHARQEWLVFLDGDMLASPDLVARYAAARAPRAILRGAIRELIATPTVRRLTDSAPGFPGIEQSRLLAEGFDPEGFRTLRSVLEVAVERRHLEGCLDLPRWLASAGANFAVSRADWNNLSGQEERFGTRWGCEDLEFSFRAQQSGFNIVYRPDAKAYHLSHVQPDRWANHARSLRLFASLADDLAVAALHLLLGERGSPDAYLAALTR